MTSKPHCLGGMIVGRAEVRVCRCPSSWAMRLGRFEDWAEPLRWKPLSSFPSSWWSLLLLNPPGLELCVGPGNILFQAFPGHWTHWGSIPVENKGCLWPWVLWLEWGVLRGSKNWVLGWGSGGNLLERRASLIFCFLLPALCTVEPQLLVRPEELSKIPGKPEV